MKVLIVNTTPENRAQYHQYTDAHWGVMCEVISAKWTVQSITHCSFVHLRNILQRRTTSEPSLCSRGTWSSPTEPPAPPSTTWLRWTPEVRPVASGRSTKYSTSSTGQIHQISALRETSEDLDLTLRQKRHLLDSVVWGYSKTDVGQRSTNFFIQQKSWWQSVVHSLCVCLCVCYVQMFSL